MFWENCKFANKIELINNPVFAEPSKHQHLCHEALWEIDGNIVLSEAALGSLTDVRNVRNQGSNVTLHPWFQGCNVNIRDSIFS